MPRGSVTTSKNGFRVEDITFRGARQQSAIQDEIQTEEDEVEDIKAPVSLTPEQIKDFLKQKIGVSKDSNERRVYSQVIRWIDDMLALNKENVSLKEKLEAYNVKEPEVEDIEE